MPKHLSQKIQAYYSKTPIPDPVFGRRQLFDRRASYPRRIWIIFTFKIIRYDNIQRVTTLNRDHCHEIRRKLDVAAQGRSDREKEWGRRWSLRFRATGTVQARCRIIFKGQLKEQGGFLGFRTYPLSKNGTLLLRLRCRSVCIQAVSHKPW